MEVQGTPALVEGEMAVRRQALIEQCSRRAGIGIGVCGDGVLRPGEGSRKVRQIASRDRGGRGDASIVEESEAVGFR